MSTTPNTKPQQGTQTQAPAYDAGNVEHVEARQKAAKRREDERVEGLRHIMATARGRTWMRHLLSEKCFTRVGRKPPAGIFTGNSTTFYNSALKELGDKLATEIAVFCPGEMRLMEDEGDSNG